MVETKIAATDRLRKEKRWSEACQYRDQVRKELRAAGKLRHEANEQAWQAMIAKFPPPEPKPVEEMTPETRARQERTPIDPLADLWEAYQRVDKPDLSVNDFVRPNAVVYYRFFQDNPVAFAGLIEKCFLMPAIRRDRAIARKSRAKGRRRGRV